jgi:hypothetical protein
MKKQLPSTPFIQEANESLAALREVLPAIISQPFWKRRIPMDEKVKFLKELAAQRASIWRLAEKEYPEIKGKPYTVGNFFVEYEAEEAEVSNQTQSLQ